MQIKYNNTLIDLPEKSSGKDLADQLNLKGPEQSLGVVINGKTHDLSHPLSDGDQVHFWHFEDREGKEIFWHTSAHLLAQAVLRLYPDAQPTIGPPIENGFYYDFANLHISEADFPKLEKEIKKILAENFKPQRHHFKDKEEALKAFAHNPYKKELIEGFEKGSVLTAYKQGEFFDLCRGPHLNSLGKIKAFKVVRTSAAYWRGDAKNTSLTRIYAISFPSREKLKDYLLLLEETKKRDHRVWGKRLNLFSFCEEAPGMPFIHPNGMVIWESLITYWKEAHRDANYVLIKTPQMMSRELWERSGHWEHYRDNMFTSKISEEREFAIKPMNCPGCMLYYRTHTHSYRELPLRIAELGHVHRREPSGALNGLFRVQSFHQDDAHLFMKPTDIKEEILGVIALVKELYQTFGLKYTFELSTRPDKSIGSARDWEVATAGLQEALDTWGEPYKINEKDGAFYGPKIDLYVHDALKRAWQCGTIQLDMSLPERFNLQYKEKTGELKRPIMIHRALFGSIERFLAILIEHFAGKFPLWLSPFPIRLIPVAQTHIDYAKQVAEKIKQAHLCCTIDTASESVSKKVRNAQLLQVNYMLIIGDRECEHQTVTLRTRDNVIHGEIELSAFISNLTNEKKRRSLTPSYQKQGEQVP